MQVGYGTEIWPIFKKLFYQEIVKFHKFIFYILLLYLVLYDTRSGIGMCKFVYQKEFIVSFSFEIYFFTNHINQHLYINPEQWVKKHFLINI